MNGWDIKREMAIPIWQDRIKACRASGMSIDLWCAENDICRNICDRGMNLIVLAAFHFQREDGQILFDHKIKFPLFMTVIIIQRKEVAVQLLGDGIFIDSAQIDIVVTAEDPETDCVPVLAGQQACIRPV